MLLTNPHAPPLFCWGPLVIFSACVFRRFQAQTSSSWQHSYRKCLLYSNTINWNVSNARLKILKLLVSKKVLIVFNILFECPNNSAPVRIHTNPFAHAGQLGVDCDYSENLKHLILWQSQQGFFKQILSTLFILIAYYIHPRTGRLEVHTYAFLTSDLDHTSVLSFLSFPYIFMLFVFLPLSSVRFSMQISD